MRFDEMRIDSIKTIIRYKPDALSFRAKNRKDHIIGINISGSAMHDPGYKQLNIYPDYIYFFNQKDDYDALTTEVGYCYSIHFTTSEPIETESFCKKVGNTEEIIKKMAGISRLPSFYYFAVEKMKKSGYNGEVLTVSRACARRS